VTKPLPDQIESFSLNSVNAPAAMLLVRQQARLFQHPHVPCGRLPGVLEDGRDFSSRHRAAIKMNREQHSPPRRMC
jgi:hypothetical protein